MSAKPTDPGRFTVSTLGVTTPNISAPSSSLRDTGFPNNYVPPAAEFNYLENIHYQWQQWLYDGNCAFAALSATSLALSAGLTVGGALAANGTLTVSAALTANSTLAVAGAISQTGGGSTSLSGALNVTGAASLSSTATITSLLTANGGVSVGTADYKHGDKVIMTSGAALDPTLPASDGSVSLSTTARHVPIVWIVGQRLKTFRVAAIGNGSATLQIRIDRVTTSGVVTSIFNNTVTPTASWADYTATDSAPAALAATETYVIRLITVGAVSVNCLRVTRDFP